MSYDLVNEAGKGLWSDIPKSGAPPIRANLHSFTTIGRVAITKSLFLTLQSLALTALVCLTLFHSLATSTYSSATLIVPCVAWAVLFVASVLLLKLQIRQRKFEDISPDTCSWIVQNDANIAVCFFLFYLCSAPVDMPDASFRFFVCK